MARQWCLAIGFVLLAYGAGCVLRIGDPIIEPGVYAPDIGGFRHSDTVLVTDDGIELLTYYPRDLESLTIPA